MSSIRSNYNRKRRSLYETSDSEGENDFPPVKKIRRRNGESNIKQSLTTRCKQAWHWFSRLPLKGYFADTMFRNTLMRNQNVETIDLSGENMDNSEETILNDVDENLEDEDEVAVIEVRSSATELVHNSSQETFGNFGVPNPVSSSTPFYRDTKTSYNGAIILPPIKQVNGYHGDSWRSKDGQQNDTSNCYSQRLISPITNPGIDVDILLDTNCISTKESDQLEVPSEPAEAMNSIELPRRSMALSYKVGRSDTSPGFDSNDSTMQENRLELERHISNSFTAHEVVRLQEKEQYKLLLDKLVSSTVYRPLLKKCSKSAEIQVDLTEEEEPVIGRHFRKEVLQKPVSEFLAKYYRPCQLKSRAPQLESHSSQQPIVEVISDTEDNDEVEMAAIKLPRYKHRSKSNYDIFSPRWIAELKEVMHSQTQQTLHIIAEQEEKVERFRKRRDAKLAEQMLSCDDLPESVEEVDEYPALSPEAEIAINSALESGNKHELLSKLDREEVNRGDISTLSGLSWLNDQIINFYIQLIVERSKFDNYPSVYAFNSFFYPTIKLKGPSNVMRWTRKVDIFSYDMVLVPLHLGMHWALIVIDNRIKKIKYYDSMRSTDVRCLDVMLNYLVVEMNNKKKINMDPNSYTLEVQKDIPQQMNGSDCGMFTLKYSEYVSRDADLRFTQEHMPYFRRKMVYEILTKQLH